MEDGRVLAYDQGAGDSGAAEFDGFEGGEGGAVF